MNQLEIWLTTLKTISVYDHPLPPLYEALAHHQPLTLRTIRQYSCQLHEAAASLQAEQVKIEKVTDRCQHLPPIPAPQIPWGF